jgi:hypothetical protein
MQLFKQVNGSRNGMHIGVHSCLFGFAGVGYRYVIYYPERYAQACPFWTEKVNSKLIEYASAIFALDDVKTWIIGFAGMSEGFDRQWSKDSSVDRCAVPCNVLLGPVLMPSRVWASIAASRAVNERPWEDSDELAVSLLAGGVKMPKAGRFVVHDHELAKSIDVELYDTRRWSERKVRIRKAGG